MSKKKPKGPTRAEETFRVNNHFVTGQITIEQWRKRMEELSDPMLWSADGKIEEVPCHS